MPQGRAGWLRSDVGLPQIALRRTDERERVRDVGGLDVREQVDERLEVAAVRGFEGVEVWVAMLLVADHEDQVVTLEEDGGRQRARDAAVAVLEGVDLREAVMQPGGLDLRADALATSWLVVPREQPVNLVLDELWRTVLVQPAVGLDRVVREALPLALEQGRGESPPQRVDGVARVLVLGQAAVQLPDERARQLPLTADEVHHHIERRALVLDQRPGLAR